MPALTIQQAFDLALQHHQAGQLAQAEQIYRQILAQQPNHADALHFLGVLAAQAGRNDIAVDLIGRAVALKPNVPEIHFNLGNALRNKGQLDEAIAAFRQALALRPNNPVACNNLGNALKEKGQLDEAIAAFRQALALRPNYPEAQMNLANALKAQGRLDEAIAAFRQAIALKPNYPEAYNNLGNTLSDCGQPDEAVAALRQAIALNSNLPETHYNLGNVLQDKGQLDEAIAAFRQAIALKPGYSDARNNLGNALKAKGQPDEAIAAYREDIARNPNMPDTYNNLGMVLVDTGQLDEAMAAFRQALALNPGYVDAHSNLLFALHYHPGNEAQAISEEHRRWNGRHAEPFQKFIQPHLNDRNPDRRLRVGYVSPDFRKHSVGRFLLPLLEHHDKNHFEVFGYAQVPVPDTMTQRLRACTDGWRNIVGLSDSAAADLIRQDRIDILVDLAGHTAHNRLLVFARKPAPVQATYLGYPNTTGLSTIDYRLTDAFADPPGQTGQNYSEQLICLAPCGWCYWSPLSPPIIERREGPITFGCFNTFAKVTEPMLRLWGRILRAVPESRLLLKAMGLGSESLRRRVRRILGDEGVGPERLELRGYEPEFAGHMELYGRMDIALDTFPYHGTTTTCEALWMGVPVITLAGPTHVSRVGVSLLSNIGLPELVAQSESDYMQIASALANDFPRLNHLRTTLRQRMEQSPLMDARGFTRNVETAYREMWRKWCAAAPTNV